VRRSDTQMIDVSPAGTALHVEVVITTYNEERVPADSIRRLHRFLMAHLPFTWRIAGHPSGASTATRVTACRSAW
jgi:hypothetical protein